MGSVSKASQEESSREIYSSMQVLLLALFCITMTTICTGWMRPRVGGMVRFGRSGDTWEDDEGVEGRTAEDYVEESDYPTTLVEQLARAVGREQDKRSLSSLHQPRGGNWFLRSRGLGK